MPWVRVEAVMPQGPKFTSAPSSATALYVNALCWTALHLTDGFIPAAQIFKLTNDHPKIVEAAIGFLAATQPGAKHPAFERVDGGFQIHDYLDPKYGNPTRAGQEALAEAGRKGGLRSAESRRASQGQGGASPDGEPSPQARPVPSRISPDGDTSRADVEELCDAMQRLVAERAKRPEITKAWRDEARLLLDRDQRPVAEAMVVMRWAAHDSFWRSNVLSIPTFRRQYDKLRLAMDRPTHGNNSIDDRARRLLALPLPALVQ